MPRTIESLLDAHHAATERRAADQPIWDRKLQIKHLLTGDSSDEAATATGTAIAEILRGSSWRTNDVSGEVAALAEEFAQADTCDLLNLALDALYDLADIDRVWIE